MNRFIIAMGVISIIIGPLAFAFMIPQSVQAQSGQGAVIHEGCSITDASKAIKINMILPGITQTVEDGDKAFTAVKNLPCFIIGIYTYFAGVAGILATVMIMYGGIKYVTSFGNQQRVTEAKDTVFSAMTGLVLTLVSYVLLYWINPNLTSFNLEITTVDKLPGVVCDDDATPLSGEGLDTCGFFGELNGVECRYERCNQGYGSDTSSYHDGTYLHDRDGIFVCDRGARDNPDADIDTLRCMSEKDRCMRISDSNEGVGLGTHEELCSPYTSDNGRCMWVDQDWFNIYRDQCVWKPALGCDDLSPYSERVNCGECVNAGKSCPGVGGKNVFCLADKDDIVYYGQGSAVQGSVQGVCCKNPATSDVQCQNGSWMFSDN